MSPSVAPAEPYFSTLAQDPETAELVDQFVGELPDRLAAILQSAEACDWPNVSRLAHQLKGAGGSYGFPQLGSAAGELERVARGRSSAVEVAAALEQLVSICTRARAGLPALRS